MRILQVFNRYLEKGGEEASVVRIANELSHRHVVFPCYYASKEWTNQKHGPGPVGRVLRMAHNPDAIRRFHDHFEIARPDLLLVHNIFPVGSAALYPAMLRTGVPVIHYIHNFRPFSVNGYCWGHDRLLPEGLRGNFLPEVAAGAWRGSRLATLYYACLLRMLHARGVFRRIDGWLAISQFMRDTFVGAGIRPERIAVLPHSWDPRATETPPTDQPALVFLGRLAEAKGVRTLLNAWQIVEQSTNRGSLTIGGGGPLEEFVRHRCAGLQRAHFAGFVSGEHKDDLLRNSAAMVVPSVWWEPLGLVVYEAYDYCRPVLAASSGGLTETVIPGETGWLHEPGDARQLAAQMIGAINDCAECARRGAAGRRWLLQHTSKDQWSDDFDQFAEQIVNRRRSDDPGKSSFC
jgi:glycosyltransferase involved in cell wall biosynthesis